MKRSGREDLLRAANGGEDLAAGESGDLEYYALLVDQYNKTPEVAGTKYVNDPAGYLVDNTEVVSGHGLLTSVRVNKAITGPLTRGLDEVLAAGGTIPTLAGGGALSMRFMVNDENVLVLSDHALGKAVDFDPKNNDHYSFPRDDAYFASAVTASFGKLLTSAAGYSDEKRLAELVSGFPQYLKDRSLAVKAEIDVISGSDVPNQVKAPLLQEKLAELIAISDDLKKAQQYPTPSFTMSRIFADTMRKYLVSRLRDSLRKLLDFLKD